MPADAPLVRLMVAGFLFQCARWISRQALLGKFIGLVFEHAGFLLPIHKLTESERVVAFHHPRPVFDEHILIVPKKAISTFSELLSDRQTKCFADALAVAQHIIREKGWRAYSLGVNGGSYQDVLQVHFHLYRERLYYEDFHGEDPEALLYSRHGTKVFPHPNPSREIHILICCSTDWTFPTQSGEALSRIFLDLDETFELTENGFTVFVQMTDLPDRYGLIFHVLSGEEKANGAIGSTA